MKKVIEFLAKLLIATIFTTAAVITTVLFTPLSIFMTLSRTSVSIKLQKK
tara:strand:+ start:363 stop:512 length:150 start_codon:yes stop_codon:yes gene_type:complete